MILKQEILHPEYNKNHLTTQIHSDIDTHAIQIKVELF